MSVPEYLTESDVHLNEECFLENKEFITYHSVIIYEFFNKKEDLKDSLNKLFLDLGKNEDFPNWRDSLNFIDDPNFVNSRIKTVIDIYENSSPNKQHFPVYNFGKYIDFIHISIISVSFSIYALEIKAFFNKKASEELNRILYSYHGSESRKIDYYGDKFPFFLNPIQIKIAEIELLKKKLKNDLLKFISKYFQGYFLKLKNESSDLIPSIDVFSYSFPKTEKKNHLPFLNCFNFNDEFFGNEHLLFFEEYYKFPKYLNKNFVLFIDKNLEKTAFDDLDSELFNGLNNSEDIINNLIQFRITFYVLGLKKWFKYQENIVSKIKSYLSFELDSLTNNKLDNLLNARNELFQKIFIFETFKSEIIDSNAIFKYSIEGTLFSKTGNFIDEIEDAIKIQSDKIHSQIVVFKYYADYNLNIKNIEFNKENIEFNKKNQKIICFLTVVVAFMTFTQLILALVQIGILKL